MIKTILRLKKNVLGVYKSESVEELENALKSQKTALKSKDLEIAKLKEQQKKDSEFKLKITESRKIIDEKLKYAVLSDSAREEIKSEKINEIGKKYGYEVKQKFNFVAHSIQHKTDSEIKEMVKNQIERVAQDKGLSKVDTELLKRSNEVKNIEKYLQNERERRNGIDQRREQNKGRGI